MSDAGLKPQVIPAILHLNGVHIADFETTVTRNTQEQNQTEVWASALTYMFDEDENNVELDNSIDGFMNRCFNINPENMEKIDTSKIGNAELKASLDKIRIADIYFHNVRFDGTFIMNWLFKNGYVSDIYNEFWYMENKHFTYLVSDLGQWYYIGVRHNNKIIIFKDSLKVLPLTVREMAKSFGLSISKGDIDYAETRYAGWKITDEEADYIKRDVLIVKSCLYEFFKLGGFGLTIGACCMTDFKNTVSPTVFKNYFPSLYYKDDDMPDETYDSFIRDSYKGGWCYCCPNKANMIYHNGCTMDVNSLYPSMMHSDSVNDYPVGKPIRVEDYTGVYWDVSLSELAKDWQKNRLLFREYYFVRIKCRFRIKDGYLPFIQVKHDNLYPSNRMLTTSNPIDKKGNEIDMNVRMGENGECIEEPFYITLTLTCVDLLLFTEHYDILEYEIQKKVVFESKIGIFDDYIDKWKQKKIEATKSGNKGLRQIAKLFLNNLYGKFGTNPIKTKAVARIEDNLLKFGIEDDSEVDKPDWGYVAVASAVTSYGRNFTIRSSQKFYYGDDKKGFIYADTDSMHINIPKSNILEICAKYNIPIDDSRFNCWAIESEWTEGKFIRQKTYIEHISNGDKSYYDVKCAGMGKRCKELFNMSLNKTDYKIAGINDNDCDEDTPIIKTYDELLFMKGLYNIKSKPDIEVEELMKMPDYERTIDDFNIGLQIPSNLKARQVEGGTLLTEYAYELRPM